MKSPCSGTDLFRARYRLAQGGIRIQAARRNASLDQRQQLAALLDVVRL